MTTGGAKPVRPAGGELHDYSSGVALTAISLRCVSWHRRESNPLSPAYEAGVEAVSLRYLV